jgi:hypothetical protein
MGDNVQSLIEYVIHARNDDSRFIINKLIYDILKISLPATRLRLKSGTSSCKNWQIIIAMLIVLQRRLPSINIIDILHSSHQVRSMYPILIRICRKVLENIEASRTPFYYFFRNNVANDLVYEFANPNGLQNGVNYLCIYAQHERGTRSISHYFNIVRENNQFIITSAYGSDLVHVPYFTSELDMGLFIAFIEALDNLHRNEERSWGIIQHFYHTYFFNGNVPVRTDDDLVEFYGKNLFRDIAINGSSLVQGPELELNYVFHDRATRHYHVGIVPQYETMIELFMPAINDQFNPPKPIKYNKRNQSRKLITNSKRHLSKKSIRKKK